MQIDDLQVERLRMDGATWRWWLAAAAVGLAGFGLAAILAATTENGRSDFFHSYLTNLMYFLSLALGGLVFVLIGHLTRAGWDVALRRVAEVVAWSVLPLGLLALVILFGLHDLYEWAHTDVVAQDALLQHKAAWLNPPFFIVRFVFYFVIWGVIAVFFLRKSTAQDATGDPELTLQMERFAPVATIVFAMTITFAAFDLVMSLYPHWYSTIFGVYYFAGSILGFFALLPVIIGFLRRRGYMTRILTAEHAHDTGKLMFGFVIFWAYIAFSQYMLIWYGNLPEETVWYELRESGNWVHLSLLLLFGHFVLPFFFLMSRHPKRRGATLVAAALWLLAMHWFDVYYLVIPGSRSAESPLRWMDLACFVGIGGIFVAAVLWRLSRVNLIPVKDPRLGESLSFENA